VEGKNTGLALALDLDPDWFRGRDLIPLSW